MRRAIQVVFGLLALSAPVAAQEAPFLALVPEARGMPAPAWVQPGARLTYYIGVGTSMGDRFVPAEQGGPDDPLYTIEGRPGKFALTKGGADGSGHGYLEVTVVAVDADAVALETRSFHLMGVGTTDTPKFGGAAGSVTATGACDWWIHPNALDALLARGSQPKGIAVARVNYDFDGRKMPAVYLAMKGAGYAFDAETGALLYRSEGGAIAGKDPAKLPDGTIVDGSGSSSSFLFFRGARQLALPWRGGAMPKWLATTKSLTYEGAHALKQPGFDAGTIATSVRQEITGGGTNWVRTKQTVENAAVPGAPPSAPMSLERVFGPGQASGLWLPPETLAQLRKGQVIDPRDRWTHVTTAVSLVGSADGRQVAVLTETSPSYRMDSHYEIETGRLVRFVMTEPQLGEMYTEIDLRLVSTK